jgi:polyhydroxyalkanoate synthesis repressor PhaR
MMIRTIKKYKNRRLYDTTTSQYVTVDQLQRYVVDGVLFEIEDSATGNDLTNSILLQIIVEMQAGPSPFLSSQILRHIIQSAHHPKHDSLKNMLEQMVQTINKSINSTKEE